MRGWTWRCSSSEGHGRSAQREWSETVVGESAVARRLSDWRAAVQARSLADGSELTDEPLGAISWVQGTVG